MRNQSCVTVSVVQAAPVLFDREASIEKACTLIRKAATAGSRLVLLPESFVPAYPRGFSFGMAIGSRSESGRRLWETYWENLVEIPGPAIDTLAATARDCQVYVAIGITERVRSTGGGILYCTLIYLGPDGVLLGAHRKLKPTAAERTIWGEGDGSSLHVFETEFGRIGGLICWENYMPMARMALYAKGVDIYLAPTADSRDSWLATIRHIACEGRCFVLSCNQFVTRSMIPDDLPALEDLAGQPETMSRGGSAIVSPMGDVLAGPLYGAEGILTAEIDMGEVVRGRLDFDVAGHYARPDIFQLTVNETRRPHVSFVTGSA